MAWRDDDWAEPASGECSVCGERVPKAAAGIPRYCPTCGTRHPAWKPGGNRSRKAKGGAQHDADADGHKEKRRRHRGDGEKAPGEE